MLTIKEHNMKHAPAGPEANISIATGRRLTEADLTLLNDAGAAAKRRQELDVLLDAPLKFDDGDLRPVEMTQSAGATPLLLATKPKEKKPKHKAVVVKQPADPLKEAYDWTQARVQMRDKKRKEMEALLTKTKIQEKKLLLKAKREGKEKFDKIMKLVNDADYKRRTDDYEGRNELSDAEIDQLIVAEKEREKKHKGKRNEAKAMMSMVGELQSMADSMLRQLPQKEQQKAKRMMNAFMPKQPKLEPTATTTTSDDSKLSAKQLKKRAKRQLQKQKKKELKNVVNAVH